MGYSLYNGETAPKALRGMLLVLYQLQIIMGWVATLSCSFSVFNSTYFQDIHQLYYRSWYTYDFWFRVLAYPGRSANALGSDYSIWNLLPS